MYIILIIFIRIAFNAYRVKEAFKTERLKVLEIIAELVVTKPTTVLMQHFSGSLWKVLMGWFFDYPFNNAYHTVFSKCVYAALKCGETETIKALFAKNRFLSRLIDLFGAKNETTGAKGFIILMCNYIRLAADTMGTEDYLPHMLTSHDAWKSFLPTLR